MTPQQSRVLLSINDYWDNMGYAPTYRDIMGFLNYKSTMVVNRHVVALAERGFINHIPRKQRSVEVSEKGKAYIQKYWNLKKVKKD